ncbi:hypothetical protein D3C78_1206170 [compost metagenome]
MSQHPEEAGEHEGAEQHRIGDAARRQQHIEHGGGGQPVQQGDQQLQQARLEGWQHQLVPAPREGRPGPQQIAQHRQQRQGADQLQQPAGPCRPARQQAGGLPQQQGAAAPGQQTEEEGDGAEQYDSGHLPRAESERGVDPVAHRGAGQQREPQGIGEGVGDEGGHADLLPGQPPAECAHRQQVIAAEAAVAEQGQQQRPAQRRQGLGPDGQPDVVPVPEVGQTIQHGQCRPQQQQAAQGAQPD